MPDTIYQFTLKAQSIPAGTAEVRFEWTPGFGAGSSAMIPVIANEATTEIKLSYPMPGSYNITATAYDDAVELATNSLGVRIAGTTLTIDPPGMTDGKLLVPYTFNFVVDDIPASTSDVVFTWSFGVGQSGVGNSGDVTSGTNRTASASSSQIYDSNGAYGLVVDVRDATTNAILAMNSVTVFVGPSKERTNTLSSCNVWTASQAGSEGVTVDSWNISAVPRDVVFDVSYEAYSIPDKFLVDYPINNVVLDSGWRGSSGNDGSPLYPGGISGDGDNDVYNAFLRLSFNSFRVTVIGPDPTTSW